MARRDVNVFEILDAQLADVSDSDTTGREQIEYIDLDLLDPDPRNFYNLPGIPELAENIRLVGLQQPLRVRPKESGHFEIVTGHRRHRALLQLAKDEGLAEFSPVPCIRERTGESASMEKVRLICGNCDNRTITGAELARQGKELDEALLGLQKEGFPFKGRRRTYVAQLLHVSETKLANVNAIENGLKNQCFIDIWRTNRMTEACALEIARMDRSTQDLLSEWLEREDEECLLRTVREFNAISFKIDHDCELAGAPCPNARNMYAAFYRGGNWEGCCGCCDMCLRKDTCESCCAFVEHAELSSSHEPEPGGMGIAPPPKLENRVELSAEDWQVRRERFSQRLRAAREETGLDRAAFAEKIGEYKATYSAWENGNLPGSGAFPRLAKALGVSTDYLYGLTDDPVPKPALAQWQPLDADHWPADQQLVILRWDNALGEWCYGTARCVGGYSDLYPFVDTDVGCELEEPSHGEYDAGYWWMPLPLTGKENQHESDKV